MFFHYNLSVLFQFLPDFFSDLLVVFGAGAVAVLMVAAVELVLPVLIEQFFQSLVEILEPPLDEVDALGALFLVVLTSRFFL